jgi:Na+/proline symporter
MCTYGVAFLPANLLFLSLGVLLTLWYQQQGIALPAQSDELLPTYITLHSSPTAFSSSFSSISSSLSAFHLSLSEFNLPLLEILFVLGIVAASFSSADSALTSLTTIYCVDIQEKGDQEGLRKRVHLVMCAVFVLFILLFHVTNSTSLIDAIYTIVSCTYGPLLGLFAFGLLTRRSTRDRWTPYVAIASPVLCYLLDVAIGALTGYHFGYELLMLNGLLTFGGLYILSVGCPLRA